MHIHPQPAAGGHEAAERGRPGKPIRQWDPLDLEVHPAGTDRTSAQRAPRRRVRQQETAPIRTARIDTRDRVRRAWWAASQARSATSRRWR
ncbi:MULTISPECIES: hypothetical protein [unclassified Kitasatospora]|uniref:hypothetical protein n=1 Tax=unclassified Kitasatospora TaxID=2633591 RepID=UPI0033D3C3CF